MKTVCISLAVVMLAASAVPGEETATGRRGPKLAIESYRLANGLKVALHRDSSVPQVVVCVAYHVGSRNERAGRTGFAHFFEHMMFRGTKNVPNFDVPLQETGAQSNAFTNEDMTVYFETVSSEYLERALYLESERLAFLPTALDQSKFDTEREVVKNERRQSVDNVPYGLVEEALLARLFPKGHPYSWTTIGSMKDLDSASLEDLRAFFAEFYHPANATLCLAGDFDPAHARVLIDRYFGPLASGAAPARVRPGAIPARAARVELADEVKLPRIHWAWTSVDDDHPDAAALDVLATVLAGGETSRLHKALVRDLRLAKDVSARNNSREIAGDFVLEATAAEGKSTAQIEAVFQAEIARLRTEPPTADELRRVLARIETSSYARLTRLLGRAIAIGVGFAAKDDPEHYRKEIDRLFRVTAADVQRVAARYLTDARVTLLVRPLRPGEVKTIPTPVGPDPQRSGPAASATRQPGPGPDWTKLPGPAAAPTVHVPRHARKTLPNGLDAWVASWKTLPIVQLSFEAPAGCGDDPAGKSGLATLVARLLDQGTSTRTATELAEAFEQLGASVRAGAGRDQTSVVVSVLARNLRPTLDLLAEMLTSPRFDPADFDRERSLQLARLLQGPEEVEWTARRVLPLLMFGPEHPFGKPVEGTVESVKSLALEDVRTFHSHGIGPVGAALIVAGDVEPVEVLRMLEQTLGRWQARNAGPRPRPAATFRPKPRTVYLVDKPGAVQSVITLGRRWVDRRDPRYFATTIGNHLVGEDFLSRLNKNLREEHGYSYGAGSGFSYQRGESVWRVRTLVRSDATAPALREILSELDGLCGGRPVTPAEVERSRSALIRGFPEEFASPSSISEILSEMARFNLPGDYLESYLPALRSVKPAEVQAAMAEVAAHSDRFLLVVGDRKSVEPALRKAGIQTIKVVTPDGKPGPG